MTRRTDVVVGFAIVSVMSSAVNEHSKVALGMTLETPNAVSIPGFRLGANAVILNFYMTGCHRLTMMMVMMLRRLQ